MYDPLCRPTSRVCYLCNGFGHHILVRSGRWGQLPPVYGPEYAPFISPLAENHPRMSVVLAISLNVTWGGSVWAITWPWIFSLFCGIWYLTEWLVATLLYYRTPHVDKCHHDSHKEDAALFLHPLDLTYILLESWTLHLNTTPRGC